MLRWTEGGHTTPRPGSCINEPKRRVSAAWTKPTCNIQVPYPIRNNFALL